MWVWTILLHHYSTSLFGTGIIKWTDPNIQGAYWHLLTAFANVPNSILFGVHCQLKRGRKQENVRVYSRRMNQWVCVSERARDRHTKTKQHHSHWLAQTTQPSLTAHVKAAKHDGKTPVFMCVCVCCDQTVFSLQMPSHGWLIAYWNMSSISVLVSANQQLPWGNQSPPTVPSLNGIRTQGLNKQNITGK